MLCRKTEGEKRNEQANIVKNIKIKPTIKIKIVKVNINIKQDELKKCKIVNHKIENKYLHLHFFIL